MSDLPGQLFAGTAVTSTVQFQNPVYGEVQSAWPNVDPSTVTLVFGVVGSLTTWTYGGTGSITKVSIGVYQAELPTTGAANQDFYVKWTGTGSCAAVSVTNFYVSATPI